MAEEKQVLFQGKGYRILAHDRYNVILEVYNADRKYKFAGYYTNIENALKSLIRNDRLMSRSETQDMKSYLKEIARYKRQIMTDIDQYFHPATVDDDELFN